MAFRQILDSSNKFSVARTINPIAEVSYPKQYVNVYEVNYVKQIDIIEYLPFKIRMTSIGLEGYERSNPAGIGIAIIGHSNYIL